MSVMKNEIKLPPPNTQKQKWKEIEFPTYYANIMQMGLTPFDISVTLGEVFTASPAEVLSTPRVKIILSPEQTSNLIQMLTAALQAYQSQYGHLRPSAVSAPQLIQKTGNVGDES
jgi:hypothetical protein